MNKNRILFGCVAWLLLVSSVVRADFDPSLHWRTISTDHFYIHFHDGEEELSQRAADIAEVVYQRITGRLNWQPWSRTHIVLNDRYEITNGYAITIPDKYINIFMMAPDEINSLEDHNGWLETVIEHEFTHIVHLDKVAGVPKVFRTLFGNVPPNYFAAGILNPSFPNYGQPRWLLEGLATYVETHNDAEIGRGQSSYVDMLMRLDVATHIKSIYEANANRREWPGGTLAYTYGVHFYQFIEKRYGEEKVKQLIEEYSDNWLGYFINTNARQVFRKDLKALWNEFEDYLREQYEPTIKQIQSQGVVGGEQLTRYGFKTRTLNVLPDGTLYFIRSDQKQISAIMRWRTSDKEPVQVAEINGDARFDVGSDGTIFATQLQFQNNFNMYYELYRLDSGSSNWKQLSDGGRYHFVAISPNGKQLAVVRVVNGGQHALHLMDTDGRLLEKWWQSEGELTVSSLQWSPDGQNLLASIWRRDRGWNIEEFDINKKTWRALTSGSAIEAQPKYTADGKAIVYAADYDGIYNIRRMERSTGKIQTLTRVIGGAFYPVLSDRGLFYVGAHVDGFDLYHIEQPKPLGDVAESALGNMPKKHSDSKSNAQHAFADYSGVEHIRPRWWVPMYGANEYRSIFSITTGGSDPLEWHNYSFNIAYDEVKDRSRVTGALNYSYNRYWPKMNLFYLRSRDVGMITYGPTAAPTTEFVEGIADEIAFDVAFPFIKYRSHWQARVGADYSLFKVVYDPLGTNLFLDEKHFLIGYAVTFENTVQPALAISKQQGRDVRLIVEHESYSGEPEKQWVVTGDWREFIHLGNTHVMALRGAGALVSNQMNTSYRVTGPEPIDATVLGAVPLFGNRDFGVRGYSDPDYALYGKRAAVGSIEYRFPLGRVQRSLMSPPIGLSQMSGALFVDGGSAWNKGYKPDTYLASTGGELGLTTQFFYLGEALIRVGVANRLKHPGTEVYVRLLSSF